MRDKVMRFGWFSTARGVTSRKLLTAAHEAIAQKEIDGRIVFVFCSREPGESPETDEFLQQVRDYEIPLVCLSSARFRRDRGAAPARSGAPLPDWRLEYDRHIMSLLEPYDFDIGVLAGYMLIVGPEMCSRHRLINLHPASPAGPTGTWQEVIWQLIETKARRSGVMMHLVTPDLDQGPPITYCSYPIRGEGFDALWRQIDGRTVAELKAQEGEQNELFRLIRQHGVARELPLVVSTLQALASGKITVSAGGGRFLREDGHQAAGYDLSDEIDRKLLGVR